jgi:hypothetical protein
MKKKKSSLVGINKNDSSSNSNSSSINIIFPFLLLVALMGFIPAGKASADTFAYASADNIVKGNFNFDKTSYAYGTPMLINGTTTISGVVGVANESIYGISETIFVGAQNQTYTKGQGVPLGLYIWGAYTFSAPSSGGNASLMVSYSYNNPIGGARVDKSVSFTFPYVISTIPSVVITKNSGSAIVYNSSDTINWTSSNASYCKCTIGTAFGSICKKSDGTDAVTATSGSFTTQKLTAKTTFVIICS